MGVGAAAVAGLAVVGPQHVDLVGVGEQLQGAVDGREADACRRARRARAWISWADRKSSKVARASATAWRWRVSAERLRQCTGGLPWRGRAGCAATDRRAGQASAKPVEATRQHDRGSRARRSGVRTSSERYAASSSPPSDAHRSPSSPSPRPSVRAEGRGSAAARSRPAPPSGPRPAAARPSASPPSPSPRRARRPAGCRSGRGRRPRGRTPGPARRRTAGAQPDGRARSPRPPAPSVTTTSATEMRRDRAEQVLLQREPRSGRPSPVIRTPPARPP